MNRGETCTIDQTFDSVTIVQEHVQNELCRMSMVPTRLSSMSEHKINKIERRGRFRFKTSLSVD